MFRDGWMPKKSIELKYLIILVNVFHMFTIKVVFPIIKTKQKTGASGFKDGMVSFNPFENSQHKFKWLLFGIKKMVLKATFKNFWYEKINQCVGMAIMIRIKHKRYPLHNANF